MGVVLLQLLYCVSFRVALLCAWIHVCQDHATCAQPQALAHANAPTVMKKSKRVVQVFYNLILKNAYQLPRRLPAALMYFQALAEFNDKSLSSLRTPMV